MKMKVILVLLAIICISHAVDDAKWEEFKKLYSKTYKDADEEKYRRGIYEENVKVIEDHNQKYKNREVTWKMAENMYTDLTADEVMKLHTGLTFEEFRVKAGLQEKEERKDKNENNNVNSASHYHVSSFTIIITLGILYFFYKRWANPRYSLMK